jgi:large subunit ribosomal protein L10
MVREEKVAATKKMKELVESSQVIGILDTHKLPSRQFQQIKKKMRDIATIKMAKKSLIRIAIKSANKENMAELEKLIPTQPAIILTKTEPFKFYMEVSKLKSQTFAKDGDVALNDIKISAGPTSLLPGPAITELTKAGIPAGVEEGKIAIKKDVVVVKKGEKISKDLAMALKKLGIETMEIGLNIVAIYDGKIYTKDVLELVNAYPEKIKEAYNQALNLSVFICYPTKANIQQLLAKAFNAAKSIENLGGAK